MTLKKKVALIVDEWGGWYDTDTSGNGQLYQQNTIRDAILAGITLNIFNNHADRVRMANLAQTVNVLQAVILTKEEKIILTPTYHVMNMYKVHQDALLIPSIIQNNTDYQGIPAISVSASKSKNGSTNISLVNLDLFKSLEVIIEIDNISMLSAQILSSDKVQDHNTFDNPDNIQPQEFTDFKIKNDKITVSIPPISVIVFEGK